jgi:hypothetical protein
MTSGDDTPLSASTVRDACLFVLRSCVTVPEIVLACTAD